MEHCPLIKNECMKDDCALFVTNEGCALWCLGLKAVAEHKEIDRKNTHFEE